MIPGQMLLQAELTHHVFDNDLHAALNAVILEWPRRARSTDHGTGRALERRQPSLVEVDRRVRPARGLGGRLHRVVRALAELEVQPARNRGHPADDWPAASAVAPARDAGWLMG